MLQTIGQTPQFAYPPPPEGYLAQKADAIVGKVAELARNTHETMNQMRFGQKLNILA